MKGCGALPISIVIISVLMLAILYSIAVLTHTVKPFMPYVSDLAVIVPGRNIFALIATILAQIVLAAAVIRYTHVRCYLGHDKKVISVCNKVSLGLIVASLVAVAIITAVPLHTYRKELHDPASFVLFLALWLYCCAQTFLTNKFRQMSVIYSSRGILVVRAILITFSMLYLIVFCLATFWASSQIATITADNRRVYRPGAENGGKKWRIIDVQAACEWLALLHLCVFIATFYYEFSRIKASVIVRTIGQETAARKTLMRRRTLDRSIVTGRMRSRKSSVASPDRRMSSSRVRSIVTPERRRSSSSPRMRRTPSGASVGHYGSASEALSHIRDAKASKSFSKNFNREHSGSSTTNQMSKDQSPE